MPTKLLALPFAATINESFAHKFPLPKEAAPSTSRFGGGGFGTSSPAVPADQTTTRAVKITSVSFSPPPTTDPAEEKLTTLRLTTTAGPSNSVGTFAIVAFPSASTSCTVLLNLRVYIDGSTQLTVTGPGTVSLFGEEFVETFRPKEKKAKRKFNKLPGGEGEEEEDFDDDRSFGADDMYDQGIVYN